MPTPNRPLTQNEYTEQNVQNSSFDKDFGLNIVETVGFDGKNVQRMNASNMTLRIEYDGNNNPIYIGIATPGTDTASNFWQVRKLTFDGNNNVTSIIYGGGSPNFDQVWDNRTSLTYT